MLTNNTFLFGVACLLVGICLSTVILLPIFEVFTVWEVILAAVTWYIALEFAKSGLFLIIFGANKNAKS